MGWGDGGGVPVEEDRMCLFGFMCAMGIGIDVCLYQGDLLAAVDSFCSWNADFQVPMGMLQCYFFFLSLYLWSLRL